MDAASSTEGELRTRVRQQEVIAELGQQALATDDLDQLMHDAAAGVAETLDVEYAKVLELLPDGEEVLLRQGVGWRDGLVGTARVPTDRDSQAGYTLLSEEPVIVEDLNTEERFSGPELLTSHDVVSGISVIIGSVEDPWGVLGTHDTSHREFTDYDATFVQSVANILGSAIEEAERREELWESEERLRLALEAGGMGTWELDLQTKESPVRSPQHDRIFGYDEPLDEWDFETFIDHVHPEDREAVKQRFEEALESGNWEFECRITRADGEQRAISAQGEVYFDSEGEPARAVGVVQDITDRKRRERELKEARYRYETLIEHYPGGVVALVDENLRYSTFGGTLEGDSDLSRQDLEGAYLPDALPEDVAEVVIEPYKAALNGEPSQFESTIDDRVYQFQFIPIRDDDGNVFAALGISQDITEHKERERDLEQFEAVARTASDVIVTIDTDSVIQYVNPAASEVFGYEPEELVGQPLTELMPDRLTDAHRVAIERYLREGERNLDWEYVELPGVRADGTEIPLAVSFSEYRHAGEHYFTGILRDITERKEQERKLEESNERLEQFAYAASHDLQEPLRMVSSYLQLLEDRYADDLDDDAEEFIDFAVDGADRMRDMIDALLEYSRVDSRGDPFEPVNLDAVFTDIRQDLQMKIEGSGAEITAEDLPKVYGDGNQLRQVFQNLLDNAIEYSGEEPPRVDVSAERAASSDDWVISVRDEGIGIDPEETDRIFEIFQSLHTREEGAGTGIGLALVERIVERHGGDIWVESDPGEGTTFTFTLPSTGESES